MNKNVRLYNKLKHYLEYVLLKRTRYRKRTRYKIRTRYKKVRKSYASQNLTEIVRVTKSN